MCISAFLLLHGVISGKFISKTLCFWPQASACNFILEIFQTPGGGWKDLCVKNDIIQDEKKEYKIWGLVLWVWVCLEFNSKSSPEQHYPFDYIWFFKLPLVGGANFFSTTKHHCLPFEPHSVAIKQCNLLVRNRMCMYL